MLIYVLIALICGLFGMIAFPLSDYIRQIEDETKCIKCNKENGCFARKPFGKNSNFVSEFMLLSYYRVRKYCQYTGRLKLKNTLVFMCVSILLAILLFWSKGMTETGILYCVSSIMLLSLAVVDWKTQYIPLEFSGIIFICGLMQVFADFSNWIEYIIGLIAVSGFLYIMNLIATPILKKRYAGEQEVDSVIGDGDIKLMAATGLLLGWKLNFIALGIGCIAGSVIHSILIKVKKGDRQFALGPYLSLGVYITMICGRQLVSWYLNMMGLDTLIK